MSAKNKRPHRDQRYRGMFLNAVSSESAKLFGVRSNWRPWLSTKAMISRTSKNRLGIETFSQDQCGWQDCSECPG